MNSYYTFIVWITYSLFCRCSRESPIIEQNLRCLLDPDVFPKPHSSVIKLPTFLKTWKIFPHPLVWRKQYLAVKPNSQLEWEYSIEKKETLVCRYVCICFSSSNQHSSPASIVTLLRIPASFARNIFRQWLKKSIYVNIYTEKTVPQL